MSGRLSGSARAQLSAVLAVIKSVLGDAAEGVYLYGSAARGGLRVGSDIDVLVVSSGRTTPTQKRQLADRLTRISDRRVRPRAWRPIEVTVVVESDVNPWRYPPRTDFQYGEWLRPRFDAGLVDPERPDNPDLAVLMAMVRPTGRTLLGAAPDQLLPVVPDADVKRALIDVIPGLLDDVNSDTANVLLTFARIWHTLETGGFVPKDVASGLAMSRLSADVRPALERARKVYLGEAADEWHDLEFEPQRAAELLVERIRSTGDSR